MKETLEEGSWERIRGQSQDTSHGMVSRQVDNQAIKCLDFANMIDDLFYQDVSKDANAHQASKCPSLTDPNDRR